MRKLLKFIVPPLALVAAAGVAPCSALWLDSTADSAWNTNIKMSGDAAGWKVDDSVEEGGFIFAFANDSKNIYLLIQPANLDGKKRLKNIYSTDFTVWVDTDGGKATGTGFRLSYSTAPADAGESLPPAVTGNDTPAATTPGAEGRAQDFAAQLQSGQPPAPMQSFRPVKVALLGFAADMEDSVEVKVGTNTSHGALEARIPLTMLGGALPKKLSFGFLANSPEATQGRAKGSGEEGFHRRESSGKEDDSEGMESGMSGGMGGHGGHGGHGGQKKKQASEGPVEVGELGVWIRVTAAKEPVVK